MNLLSGRSFMGSIKSYIENSIALLYNHNEHCYLLSGFEGGCLHVGK